MDDEREGGEGEGVKMKRWHIICHKVPDYFEVKTTDNNYNKFNHYKTHTHTHI